MKKGPVLLQSLLLIAVLSALASSFESMHTATMDSGNTLTLIVSGSELGYLEPCGCAEGQLGGFARRGSLIQQLAAKGKNLLPIANGNLIDNAGRQSELKAEIGFTALKEMGYIAFNVGPKDLLLGIDRLKHFSETSGISFLSANLFQGDEPIFQPFVIHTVNLSDSQVRVAIVGILSQHFEMMAQSADINMRLESPYVVLRGLIGQLREKSDLIVLLAHTSRIELEALASAFPQIDVIAHRHEQKESQGDFILVGETVLLDTSTKGKSVGKLEIRWNDDRKISDSAFQSLPLSERVPDSPRIVALLKVYQQILAAENLSRNLSQEQPSTGGMFVGSTSCKKCHAEAYAIWKKSKHAHAYDTLVEAGHAADPECLTCHTVGFGFQTGFLDSFHTPLLVDVGCENCHGVGGNHVKNPQKGYGQVTKADCFVCHTMENSPKFNYEGDLPKIRHW